MSSTKPSRLIVVTKAQIASLFAGYLIFVAIACGAIYFSYHQHSKDIEALQTNATALKTAADAAKVQASLAKAQAVLAHKQNIKIAAQSRAISTFIVKRCVADKQGDAVKGKLLNEIAESQYVIVKKRAANGFIDPARAEVKQYGHLLSQYAAIINNQAFPAYCHSPLAP